MSNVIDLNKPFQIDENLLFHYTKHNTAIENIIPNMTLRFNSFTSTNDPLEFFNFHFTSITSSSYPHWGDLIIKGKGINELRNKTKFTSFCIDKEYDKSYEIIYHRGFGKSRMWSQYAENHKGICIVFDKELLISSIKKQITDSDLFYEKVSYDNQLKKLIASLELTEKDADSSEKELFERSFKEYLFTKLKDFEHEQEYRICILDKSKDTSKIDIIIKDSLKAIILGVSFPTEAYKILLDDYKNKYKIEIYKMDSSNGNFDITDWNGS